MSCAYEEELTAYVDGELDEISRRTVESHLAGCAPCRGSLALVRQAVAELRALPPFEPSRDLRRHVLHRIHQGSLARRLRGWVGRPAVWLPAGALAAGLIVAVAMSARVDRGLAIPDVAQLELAANLEEIEDLEVVGLEDPDDLEIILELHELEGAP
jgi:anti-sigma factor RsiW